MRVITTVAVLQDQGQRGGSLCDHAYRTEPHRIAGKARFGQRHRIAGGPDSAASAHRQHLARGRGFGLNRGVLRRATL